MEGDKRVPPCPKCGSPHTKPILYGLPTWEAIQAAERGEVVLAGCVLMGDDPKWYCPECGHRWGRFHLDDE